MSDSRPMQPTAVQSLPAKGLGTTALVFGILSTAITGLAALLSAVSIAGGDPGWMMVTALLVMPVGGVLAVILGLIAVILAVILVIRTKGQNRRWIPALVLGLVGMALIPGFLVLVNLVSF